MVKEPPHLAPGHSVYVQLLEQLWTEQIYYCKIVKKSSVLRSSQFYKSKFAPSKAAPKSAHPGAGWALGVKLTSPLLGEVVLPFPPCHINQITITSIVFANTFLLLMVITPPLGELS